MRARPPTSLALVSGCGRALGRSLRLRQCLHRRLTTRFDFTDALGACHGQQRFPRAQPGAQYYQATGSCPCGTTLVAQVSSPAAVALGATPLKLEKATNYSLGVTWDPSPAFHLAVDAYQIDIRGQLGQSSQIGYNAQDPARITDNSGTVLTAAQKNTIDALLGSAGISILPGDAFYASYFTNRYNPHTRCRADPGGQPGNRVGKLRWSYAANGRAPPSRRSATFRRRCRGCRTSTC